MAKLNLAIPLYDQALQTLLHGVVDGFIATDQLLQNFPTRVTYHKGPTRIIEKGTVLNQPLSPQHFVLDIETETIRRSKLDEYSKVIEKYAQEVKTARVKLSLNTIFETTEAIGNNITADKQKSWFDAITDSLEKIDLQLDDDGNILMPTILVNPETFEQHKDEQPTMEEAIRRKEVLAKRKAELLAKKRTRRLTN